MCIQDTLLFEVLRYLECLTIHKYYSLLEYDYEFLSGGSEIFGLLYHSFLFISAMQQAVIFFNRTTFFQSFARTKPRTPGTECTERAKPRDSPP